VSGEYDSVAAFQTLNQQLVEVESKSGGPAANRLFYLAIPPSVFASASKSLREAAFSPSGWNRVIVEKPFGK